MVDRQKRPPIDQPMLKGGYLTPIWRRWFQDLKVRDDEIRRKAYKVFTADQALTTSDLGKTLIFQVASSNITCTLPPVATTEVYSWLTIVREGDGKLKIETNSASEYIERNGRAISCKEPNRIAANVTVQLVSSTQWAIIGGTGIWSVLPY